MSSVHFLDGGGEMAKAILAHDWASNPLGPLEQWPSALKTTLSMALNSRFPKCLFWGAQMISIHNDAFRPILGGKSPATGRPPARDAARSKIQGRIAVLIAGTMHGCAQAYESGTRTTACAISSRLTKPGWRRARHFSRHVAGELLGNDQATRYGCMVKRISLWKAGKFLIVSGDR